MKDLITLYQISSQSGHEDVMLNHLTDELSSYGLELYCDGSYNLYAVYGKAESYPCIVAHMDEVHSKRPKDYKVIQTHGLLYGISESKHQFVGIGADDKNGLWVALKIAKLFVRLHKPIKVAFFVSEEIGCVGSSKSELSFFKDCRFILECDRRGSSDFITKIGGVQLCSTEFGKAVAPILKEFGYKTAKGLSTDVCELVERGVGISTCNISCGYHNPHTDEEMTDMRQLRNCLAMVNVLMRMEQTFPHKYEPPANLYRYTDWYWNGRYYGKKTDPIGWSRDEHSRDYYEDGYFDYDTGKFVSYFDTQDKKEKEVKNQ